MGGIYITGGVTKKMREWLLKEGSFMKAYYDKGGAWSDAEDWSNFACTLTPLRESNLLAHTHKDVMLEQGTAIAVWDLEA